MLRTGKTAASVFPVAVGEIRRTLFPSRILEIVFSCGSVGFSNPFCSINLRIGLTSKSKVFADCEVVKAFASGARKDTKPKEM
jgi:hypothetical protein